MEANKKTRRAFIQESLRTTVALAAASSFVSSCSTASDELAPVGTTSDTLELLTPEGEIVKIDSAVVKEMPQFQVANRDIRQGVKGKKFVMVIDLSKCRNALKCKSACSKMHYLPEDRSYVRVNEMQDAETTAPYWMPITCFHCDNPPCTKVCPVDATFKLSDGIVAIDNERCIGCRFCMVACPYSSRVFNWGDEVLEMDSSNLEAISSHLACSSHEVGTVEKCDFCPQMAEKNELPDCVSACPNGVFYFGDENEDTVTNGGETVRLSTLIREKAAYRFMEELGTKPRVYYIPPVDRLFPFEETLNDGTDKS
ncbi:MAG: 4Fe-4S dicluster domain-containing protein [Flavobacteriales bacterium]|nr:4Fe-4S dicluster domain-containing protein [Flavobacteriales bacterium]